MIDKIRQHTAINTQLPVESRRKPGRREYRINIIKRLDVCIVKIVQSENHNRSKLANDRTDPPRQVVSPVSHDNLGLEPRQVFFQKREKIFLIFFIELMEARYRTAKEVGDDASNI